MSGAAGIPKPNQQDLLQVVTVDEAVKEYFPPGAKLIAAKPHGASFWTRTASLEVELEDKAVRKYFLKLGSGELGKSMLRGEHEGVKEIYKYTPEGIPRAIAWGTYRSDPNTHFYLADFVDIIEELPDISKFCAMLAKLHHESMADPNASPEYGFHVMTHEGSMYQCVDWAKTWEDFYKNRMQSFIDQERVSQGPSEELDRLIPPFMEKVIPRLLRPLGTHGRVLKPCIIHADIWCGNIGIRADTGHPVYFDPSVFWGHNEYDVGSMATPRYRLGRHWMREYHKYFPISAPEEDYEDRNALYAISGHFCASTLYPDNQNFRNMAIEDMEKLLEKYPNGYQGE